MRTHTLNTKSNSNSKGFTLLEICISIVIVSMMLATAAPLYKKYLQNKKKEQTGIALIQASNAIGGFKSIYGRYPCPAPADALPGDIDYGYEDCTATAPGIRTTASARVPALANPNVIIGTLPFRTLSLQESQIYDGFKNRLTYAVTQSLTVDATYDSALGGISIIDKNDGTLDTHSLITPPNSGHFVVVSHGENDEGSFGYNGVRKGTCTALTTLANDIENCDDDAVFRVSQIEQDFDDTTIYSSSIDVSPWQYGNNVGTNDNDIFLRRGDSVVLGQNDSIIAPLTPLTQTFEVRARGTSQPDDGVLFVDEAFDNIGNPLPASSGAIMSTEICDQNGANCIQPNRLGGTLSPGPYSSSAGASTLTPSYPPATIGDPDIVFLGDTTANGGMVCPGNSVIVGIEDGLPICSNEITFACPNSPTREYMSGITASGAPECSVIPAPNCPDTNIVTTCGENKTIPGAISGDYSTVYSGQCYMITDPFDPVAAQAEIDSVGPSASITAKVNQLRSGYLDTIGRTQMSCANSKGGTNDINNLVRDTHLCNNGNFDTIPALTQERLTFNTTWPGSGLATTGGFVAEPNVTAYSLTADPNHDNSGGTAHHDCWCREDYGTRTIACGTGPVLGTVGSGTIEVFKFNCPVTDNPHTTAVWQAIGPGLCTCDTSDVVQQETCAAHYGISSTGLTPGPVVDITYTVACSSPSATPILTLDSVDASACFCEPAPDQNTGSRNCPTGFINNPFTYRGNNYDDKEWVRSRQWICPTGTGPAGSINPANVSGERGYRSGHTYYFPATDGNPCVCDTSWRGTAPDPCPAGTEGTDGVIETRMDCGGTGLPIPTGVELTPRSCQACKWKEPAGTPTFVTTGGGLPVGNNCSPCGSSGSCKTNATGGFNTWDSCSCIAY